MHSALYETLQCSGVTKIYSQLEEGVWGQSAIGICAFCNILKLCGIEVMHRSNVEWRRGSVASLLWVYAHSAIYDTYLV